jgi:tetratricopeptide (TPR) repeat protein
MDSRVEEIWAAAREVPADSRYAWLEKRCGGDLALRDEVASLLRHADEGEAFFARLTVSVHRSAEELSSAALDPGARVGPYIVIREIGRGGMGLVYEGQDPRLERRVALKVLPPWLAADPDARKRLVAEARAASAIEHPNLATLHDVVELTDGSLCLVLAHYEGETLKDRLDRGPMPVAEAVDAVRQAARGLAEVHRRGIVHRDVKPANLFLTAEGRVVVLDFGIAKVRGADPTRRALPGTVAYMAPEQARGEPVDARTDVWALGVVLYEAVTGRNPFRRDADAATLDAIARYEPRRLDAVRLGVPRSVALATARALAKEPTARYPDAGALVAGLEGRGAARRVTRPWTVAALLALLAGGSWLEHGARATGETRAGAAAVPRVAVLPFEIAGNPELAYLREGMVNLLSVSLDGAGGLHSIDPNAVLGETESQGDVDLEAAGALARRLGARRYVLGNVIEVAGRLRIQASLYDPTRGPEPVARVSVEGSVDRIFNLVDEITAQLVVAERRGPGEELTHVAAVTTGSLEAFKWYLTGEQRYREGRFTAAIDAFERAVASDSLFALAWYRLSVAAGWIERYEEALAAAETAERLNEHLPPLERRIVEANLAIPRGEPDRAERLYREVLAQRPENPEAWFGLGEIHFHLNPIRGRSFTEARRPFERALALYGRDYTEAIIHLADLAAWEGRANDYERLYRRLDPQGDLALVYGAQKAFVIGDAAERDLVMGRLREANPARIRHAGVRTSGIGRNPRAGLAIVRLLTEPRHPPEWRAIGHLMTATLEAALGRWSAARAELDRAEPIAPAQARLARGWIAAHPLLGVPRKDIEAIRDSLAAWDPRDAPQATNPILAIHEGLYPQVREYVLGLLAHRLGDAAAVRRHAAALARYRDPTEAQDLSRDLALDLRARAAALEGDREEALEILDSMRLPRRHDHIVWSPFYQLGLTRFFRAELVRELGRSDEALEWYTSLSQLYFDVAVFHAPVDLRRAQILDGMGRRAEAAEAYRRFVGLWRDADPALRPLVARAQMRLAALRGAVRRG